MTYRLVGHMAKGNAPDTVVGHLRCPIFGTTFVLTGTRDSTGYALEATPGPVPDNLKVPWVDDND